VTIAIAAPARRSGRWLEDPGFGVYVHIPFCLHRCHYCDFNTYEGQEELHERYVDALIRDVERNVVDRPATSVFFGGGTPTLLAPRALGSILDAVRDSIGIAGDAEITVEANPETVDATAFEGLLGVGFNRFSVGVQSLVPRVLEGLGRTHGADTATDALRAARRAGVEDINADLIYGSPWETDDDWRATLARIVDEGPDHVSAYALTVEESTPLATMVATGRVPNVDGDVQAARHAVAEEFLGTAGYERYEISNWSRPGRASAHNVLYWSAGDYLGFGAGAHGHVAGRRSWATRLPRDFIAAVDGGTTTEAGYERLDDDARAGEALILGLRLATGIDLDGFTRRFGPDVIERRDEAIARYLDSGLLERADNALRLSGRGTMLANEVQAALL
jgi:oxygen-independent coproporphyrinogen-3 oxidase